MHLLKGYSFKKISVLLLSGKCYKLDVEVLTGFQVLIAILLRHFEKEIIVKDTAMI